MRKVFGVFILFYYALSAQLILAQQIQPVTVYYQPTPYPASINAIIPDSAKHFSDGWLLTDENWNPIPINGSYMQQGYWLYVGGSNSHYRYLSYLKFNLTGLPQHVDLAYFWLYPGLISSPWVGSPYAVCPNLSTWDSLSNREAILALNQCAGWYPTPGANNWAGFWASGTGVYDWLNWYNKWQNRTLANNGVMIFSQNLTQDLNAFYSSSYNDCQAYAYADYLRPILQLTFTPTLELKMPLKGLQSPKKLSWLVTTEAGGYDCLGHVPDGSNDPWPDPYHSDSTGPGNYFSIDFSWKNEDANKAEVFSENDNIPVLAAASGKVIIPSDSGPDFPNGNYIVIDHDSDGNISTGFTTRYLHLKTILVPNNANVTQGAMLGYMGNTGRSNGTHLHFGVRYNGSGASTVPQLAKVVMDGWLLKSFQTECAVDPTTGIPTEKIRYYQSSNY